MAPLVITIYLFKLPVGKIDKQILVRSINTCLLLGSTLFFTKIFWPIGIFVVVDIICKMLLPQLLWFKKLRKSIGALMVIYGSWVISYFIDISAMIFKPVSIPSQNGSTWVNYSLSYFWQDILTYIVILTVIYLLLKRKKLTGPKSTFAGN
jgi:hypothetical protein